MMEGTRVLNENEINLEFEKSGLKSVFKEMSDVLNKPKDERNEKEKVLANGFDKILKNISDIEEINKAFVENTGNDLFLKVESNKETLLTAKVEYKGIIGIQRCDQKGRFLRIYNYFGPKELLMEKLTDFVTDK